MKRISIALLCLFGFVVVAKIQAQHPSPSFSFFQPKHPFEQALTLYSALTGRTILRPWNLSAALKESDLQTLPPDTNAAAAFIESKFRQHGITVISDGKLFTLVVPAGWTNTVEAKFISTIKPPLPDKETIAQATVNWVSATLEQGLMVHAEFRGRTLLRPISLGHPMLQLRNQQPMTKNEFSYALTVLLALNGIAVVDDGDKLMQVVDMEKCSQVVTHAPKPATNAIVLDPKKLPKFEPEATTVRVRQLNKIYSRFFSDTPPWTPRPMTKLADFYAELTDQTFVPTKTLNGQRNILFEVKKPLTKEELVYAIETLLRLEGLEIGNVGKNKFSLFPLGTKARADKEKKPAAEKR